MPIGDARRGRNGRMLTHREIIHSVDSYSTTQSDTKKRRTTRLLLSSADKRSSEVIDIYNVNKLSKVK